MPRAISIKGAYSPGEKTWQESSLKAEKAIAPTRPSHLPVSPKERGAMSRIHEDYSSETDLLTD